MKKIFVLLMMVFAFSSFACLMTDNEQEQATTIITNNVNVSPQNVTVIISKINNVRVTLQNSGMDSDNITIISNRLVHLNNPNVLINCGDTLVNGLGTAQQNAVNQGFQSLAVDSVTESGDGVQVTLSSTNGNSTMTTQVDATTTTPGYTTSGSVAFSPSAIATRNSISGLNSIASEYIPSVSTTTTNDSSTGRQVRLIPSAKVSVDGATSSILSANVIKNGGQSTVSGKPKVVNTTTTTITNANGTSTTIKTSSSKLAIAQTTNTTITRSNGTSVTVQNIGDAVGDVTHSTMAQQRFDTGTEILQGTSITVANGHIVVNGVATTYSASDTSGVYNVTVHAVNGDPTTVVAQSGDTVGSTNAVTYWINGSDSGVTANMAITRTVTAQNGTILSGNTITSERFDNVLPQTVASYPIMLTIANAEDFDCTEYIGSYTLNTTGQNKGYYVKSDGNQRFKISASASSSVCSSWYSSVFTSCPYASEFETKWGNNFYKRDDFVFCSQNVVTSNIWVGTKFSLNNASHPLITASSDTVSVDNTNAYYVVDGVTTTTVASAQDIIRESYTPVDPASANEQTVTTSSNVKVYDSNNNLLLTTSDLGVMVISSITKSGKTISGTLTHETLKFVTKDSVVKYGRAVSVVNGLVYIDGVNTGFSSADTDLIYENKECYIENGNVTDVLYSSDDNVSSVSYYTNNGVLTNIQYNANNNVVVTNSEIQGSNQFSDVTYTINTSSRSYQASSIALTSGYQIATSGYGNLYYNNTATTNTTDLISYNGNVIGKRSDARFYTVTSASTVNSGIYAVSSNGNYFLQSVTSPTYLPRFDGCFFVNNGQLNHYQGNGSTIVATISSPIYGFTARKTEGRFVLLASNTECSLKEFLYYGIVTPYSWPSYGLIMDSRFPVSGIDDARLFLSYAVIGSMNRTYCVSSFSSEGQNFISMAGQGGWGYTSIGISPEGAMYGGNGHINRVLDANQDWSEVYLMYGGYNFVARKRNGQIYYIEGYHGSSSATKTLINNPYTLSKIDSDRDGTFYGVSGNNLVLFVKRSATANVTYKAIGFQTAIKDIVVGRSVVGVLTVDGNLYVAEVSKGQDAATTTISFNHSSVVNVSEIGVCSNKVLAITRGIQQNTSVAMVDIGGRAYPVSDVTFSSVTTYVLDGVNTNYVANASDVTTNVNYYNLALKGSSETVKIKTTDVTSTDYRNVARSVDGGVLGIVTVVNGNYCVNGNTTDIPATLTDNFSVSSVKTYYVGDVDTGIASGNDDLIQVRGDYWTVNGRNTAVRFFGIGEMCVRVSDVTAGELTEEETGTVSSVVVPLVIRAQIVRFDSTKPITSIRIQYRKVDDQNWTNIKELTNAVRPLETNRLEAIFGRYVNVPVSQSESFYLRVNISDGTTSTVTASSLEPEEGNVFYFSFIRSTKTRLQ